MTRIVKTIEIEGQQSIALFDTGAIYTYVRSPLVREAPRRAMIPPARVALGGRDIEIRELCIIQGKIEGLCFLTDAVPVEEIGVADGHELDALIGARTMEQWEIRIDLKTGELDLEGLRRREFKPRHSKVVHNAKSAFLNSGIVDNSLTLSQRYETVYYAEVWIVCHAEV